MPEPLLSQLAKSGLSPWQDLPLSPANRVALDVATRSIHMGTRLPLSLWIERLREREGGSEGGGGGGIEDGLSG